MSRPRNYLKQSSLLWLLLALYVVLSVYSWSSFYRQQDEAQKPKIMDDAPAKKAKTNPPRNPLEDLSSVDYWACCGLGHRLIRMSLAHYVAKQRNFSLRSFWGWCGEQKPIEVFSYLFQPYLASELPPNIDSNNLLLPFYNEVPGFSALVRKPTNSTEECACRTDKIASDFELYTSLRNRFRDKKVVDGLVQAYYADARVVIGIHVRAGNGEGGDFERKKRGIESPEQWVHNVCKHLRDLFLYASSQLEQEKDEASKQFVLYVATDTPSVIAVFRNELASSKDIKVLALPQQRIKEGQGVLFGEAFKVHNKDDAKEGEDIDDYSSCLKGWTDTLTDMFLLSHADIVVAGKPSSFSQTLPMSLAFGNDKVRKKMPENVGPYCEIVPQFEEKVQYVMNFKNVSKWEEVEPNLQCYNSYMDWCCNYATWIEFYHNGPRGNPKIHSKEFVKFPRNQTLKEYPGMRNRTLDCLRPKRGHAGGGRKDKCLPHEW